jgi:hypothetical protein
MDVSLAILHSYTFDFLQIITVDCSFARLEGVEQKGEERLTN